MPKFNFNLRNPQASGYTPVYLIIRYQKYRIVYPTGERVLPASWDKKKQHQKSISTHPEMRPYDLPPNQKKEYNTIRNFNSRLSEIQLIARQIFDNFIKQNDKEEPEPKEYKLLLDVELEKKEYARKDFFTYMKNFIEEKKKIAVENGTEHYRGALYKSYAQLYTHLSGYAEFTSSEIDFRDIDIDFYYYFADYLRNQKNLLPNTIGKHIKSLKTIMNSATDSGLNSNIVFKSKFFKVITEKVDTLFLDESELASIARLDLSGEVLLAQVRDLFLISARTGLRNAEFHRIQAIDPEKSFIEITDSKSNDTLSLPLHPDLLQIARTYWETPQSNSLPEFSNVKMNATIKQICEKIPHFHTHTQIDLIRRKKGEKITTPNVSIYELVSMQTARQSFFSNQYKGGTDIYFLMAISGHRSPEGFLRFTGIPSDKHADNMRRRWQNINELQDDME